MPSDVALAYYFIVSDDETCDDIPNAFPIPMPKNSIRVRDIKAHFPLPGDYSFRFKTPWSKREAVFADLTDVDSLVPLFNQQIVCKVTRLSWTKVQQPRSSVKVVSVNLKKSAPQSNPIIGGPPDLLGEPPAPGQTLCSQKPPASSTSPGADLLNFALAGSNFPTTSSRSGSLVSQPPADTALSGLNPSTDESKEEFNATTVSKSSTGSKSLNPNSLMQGFESWGTDGMPPAPAPQPKHPPQHHQWGVKPPSESKEPMDDFKLF